MGPVVLIITLIKRLDGKILNLQVIPSQERLQRLWRINMILTNWDNKAKRTQLSVRKQGNSTIVAKMWAARL